MDEKSFGTITLQHLVARIQQGDRSATDELLNRTLNRLERLARKLAGQFPQLSRWADKDDVLQLSLLRLLRALQTIQPTSTRAYFGLAAEQMRRELLDLCRRFKKAAQSIEPSDGDSSAPRIDVAAPSSPEAEFDRWEAFHEHVETLPVEQREVVSLVFYHGWTQVEVADLFQVTERTVRRWWHLALNSLNESIQARDLTD